MLVAEAVSKLGEHGHASNNENKNIWRRSIVTSAKLKVDVVGHDTKHNARKEELNQADGEHEKVGGGKGCESSDLRKEIHLREEGIRMLLERVPHFHHFLISGIKARC